MIRNTSILITGGTGSFGKAFIKYILAEKPHRLVVFSRGEHLQEEMAREFNDPCLRFFIGDVRDAKRLEMAMNGIDIVIHAAALKIVPICEYNPIEAVHTNITGAENVIRASLSTRVRKVIALSTDKAVNPVNLYGATKLAAEKLFMAARSLSGNHGCRFSVVRYGNVVGSRGSVVPFFRSVARQNLPIPITHPEMTRFWITMDRAISAVTNALNMMEGAEIFVPKIPSIRISDLATAIAPGRQQNVIGIRPGEKIHEVLMTEDESNCAIDAGDQFIIYPHGDPRPKAHWQWKPVPPDYRYSSEYNERWLSITELREMLLS